ncbi:MAG: DNA-binding protein Alba [Candidatus Hodarchaeales archaeon]|jgi:DNA-binding protein
MSGNENTVFVGNKPITSYVMAVVTQFNQTNSDIITIKARGRAISRAVDVAEVLRKRFMQGQVDIESIKSDTEQITTREGQRSNVSAIEITLKKIKK